MASQVQPSLMELEHIITFINTLERVYFEKLVGSVTFNFFNLIITSSQIEDAIRYGKLSNDYAKAIKPNAEKLSFLKKNKEGIQIVGQIITSLYGPYLATMHLAHSYFSYSPTYPFKPTPYQALYQSYVFLPALLSSISRSVNAISVTHSNQTFLYAIPIELKKDRKAFDLCLSLTLRCFTIL